MKQVLKKNGYYLIPPLIVLIIISITYFVKNVYPFGNSNIAYYDMTQQYIPLYSRNYEIAHGNDSIFFSWISGSDMSNSFPGYVLFPLNWIFFFLNPSSLLRFMGLFLLIKLMLISVAVSIYLKKSYSLSILPHLTLCLTYTFSGYILQYYTNIMFLDSILLFPLLFLAQLLIGDEAAHAVIFSCTPYLASSSTGFPPVPSFFAFPLPTA